MTEHELLAEFTRLGALKQGHFQLTSGLHSRQYVQCAAVFEYPAHAEKIAAELVKKLPQDIDTKSTRLNSSHVKISYAVFCLKKKKKKNRSSSSKTNADAIVHITTSGCKIDETS